MVMCAIHCVHNLLMDPVWKAIFRLERMGLHVLALTCDGASTNRRLWKLHSNDAFVNKIILQIVTSTCFLILPTY